MLLAFDPSGNYTAKEGKGTTGWAVFKGNELYNFGDIKATDHEQIEAYWYEHLCMMMSRERKASAVMGPGEFKVICESYRLQPGKAKQQSWSSLETPQLIGCMRMTAWEKAYPFILQDPAIKARFSDEVLVELGIAEKRGQYYYIQGRQTNGHMRDAIRHGLYYLRYGVKKNVERKDNSDSIK